MTVFVYFPQNTVMNGGCCRMNKTGNLSSGITGEREQNENIILKYWIYLLWEYSSSEFSRRLSVETWKCVKYCPGCSWIVGITSIDDVYNWHCFEGWSWIQKDTPDFWMSRRRFNGLSPGRGLGWLTVLWGPQPDIQEMIFLGNVYLAGSASWGRLQYDWQRWLKLQKGRILDTGLSSSELERMAWVSALRFRVTDYRGGNNGARIRLNP